MTERGAAPEQENVPLAFHTDEIPTLGADAEGSRIGIARRMPPEAVAPRWLCCRWPPRR